MKLDPIEYRRRVRELRALTIEAARGTSKTLAADRTAITKKFGQEALADFAAAAPLDVWSVSTGFQDIDDLITGAVRLGPTGKMATVVGSGRGVPRARILEIFGPEGGGKTTFALQAVVAAFQAIGLTTAFVDAEHALDLDYARKLGVDARRLMLHQPDSAEQGWEVVKTLVKRGVDCVVLDSLAAMTPQAELDGEIGDAHVGLAARLHSQALRIVSSQLGIDNGKSHTTLVLINQIRQKIGGFARFGPPPETTPGGNAPRFFASIRMEIRQVGMVGGRGRGDSSGLRARCRVIKNKVAAPFREVYADIAEGRGIIATHSKLNRDSDSRGSRSDDDDGDT